MRKYTVKNEEELIKGHVVEIRYSGKADGKILDC
jgi:hypothetical protein